MGERRILLDRNEAIARFQSGEQGELKLDILTTAYNDLDLVPRYFSGFYGSEDYFLDEVGIEPNSRMLYKSSYTYRGKDYPIVLLSRIDQIEISFREVVYASAIVMTIFSLLIISFGAILYRLSHRLIEPFNSLASQLEASDKCLSSDFKVSDSAAIEFRRLTDQLNEYRRQINSLVKREQAFARYSSHELRTPLTVARGSSKLLLRSEMTEFQARQVERIDESVIQMSEMVDALLGLVRYERNSDDAPVRLFSQEELQSIIDKNSAQASDKNLNIKLTVTSEPTMQATRAIMNMLIGNLLRNAIAATSAGEVSILLNKDHIFIEDQGEGLQAQYNPQGHGLGLLIVDDLCRRFDWTFTLSNRSLGGCRARIDFART